MPATSTTITWSDCPDEITALRAEVAALQEDAERYATVRLMNASQFRDALLLNRRTGKPFDEIVSDLRPFFCPEARSA